MELSENPASPGHKSPVSLKHRKSRHMEICLGNSSQSVETPNWYFSAVRLIHHALPELSMEGLDCSCEFLGYRLPAPFFISSMTGGGEAGLKTNRALAQAAQEYRLGLGTGSIRVLFRHPELLDHFMLKSLAPDVPVWANLGGVQIRDMVHGQIVQMLKRLEVDAIAIHLNAGQELFQSDGDRDFKDILASIRCFCQVCPVPVMVKETGCGIHPAEVLRLLNAGVKLVDVAGSGGTDWIKVERQRHLEEDPDLASQAEEFEGWGTPTALILATLRHLQDDGRLPGIRIPPPLHLDNTQRHRQKPGSAQDSHKEGPGQSHPRSPGLLGGRILASGGIRTPMEAAKSLVLGARMVGMALPFLQVLDQDGVEGIGRLAGHFTQVLRKTMLLSNCADLDQFRASSYLVSAEIQREIEQFGRLFYC